MEIHNIEPIFDKNSRILILGSFPSVKSREQRFFYGHPQNRFWRVLAEIYGERVPESISEKRQMLLNNNTALWDVIKSCNIVGSSDSSIKDAVANDVSVILSNANICKIITNGKTAHRLYQKYLLPQTDVQDICLPSTSPANAAFSLELLIERWKAAILF